MLKTLFISLLLAFHPVHVSMMSVEYSSENKGFKVFLKVYYDDFLRDLGSLKGFTPAGERTTGEKPGSSDISSYLKERVLLLAGETELIPELVDFSLADNELKMNLIYRMKKGGSVYTVKNYILADIYKDQANLVLFKYGRFEEGVKLTSENREYRFNIKK
jgi:hypothetical protein